MDKHLVRTFDAELAADGDGRTLTARIVPYNTPTWVADPPHYTRYQEMFVPGAFDDQMRAAHRVPIWLNFEHEQGIRGLIGHGTELDDRPDALYGTFRVDDNVDGNKALGYVNQGLLTGVSMEFSTRGRHERNGVVERRRAHIQAVSLCRQPAWDEARVLAVRARPAGRSRPRPPMFDKQLAARVARFVDVPATLLLERMDDEDLATLGQMLDLGNSYIEEQDEPEDQKNIPVMKEALALISSLVPVEVAEQEPDEPEEDE